MSGLKVLVFESDRDFAGAVTQAFRQRGCVTRVVDDGQAGLDIAQIERPDLIILAIELPRMNGFAVCNRLKKHPDLKDVPLVIVSSDSPLETFDQHSKLRTRAEDYVHKPLTPEALIARCAVFVAIPPVNHGPEGVVEAKATEVASSGRDPDLEISVLSDAAFDNIIMDPPAAAPQPEAPDEFDDFTVVSPKSLLAEIARRSSVPPSPLRAPSAPSVTVSLQTELDRTRHSLEGLERDLATARSAAMKTEDDSRKVREISDEFARISRENEEMKKASAKPHGGGVSTREFLELREALNRKDKEILQLKEAVNGRDKQVLEARETLLHRDLEKNDLEEKVLQRELEVADAQERAQLAAQERQDAADAADAAEMRLSEALRASEASRAALESENSALQSALRDATSRSGASEGSLAEARAALDEAARAHAEALDSLKGEHQRALESASLERQQSLDALREDHRDALAALSVGLDDAERLRSAQIAAQNTSHAEALGALRADYERALADVDSLRAEHEAALTSLRAEHEQKHNDSEARRSEDLSRAESDAATRESAARESLETLRAERSEALAALEATNQSALSEIQAQGELAAQQAHGAHRSERDALSSEIEALRSARDGLSRKLSEVLKQAARNAGLWAQARRALQIAAAFSEQVELGLEAHGEEPTTS